MTTLKIVLTILCIAFALTLVIRVTSRPQSDAQAIGLQLRAIANQIEESNLPNKSDIAERVEALSAEVLANQ